MPRRRKKRPPKSDAEFLTIWLFHACQDNDQRQGLRLLAERAMKLARKCNLGQESARSDGLDPEDEIVTLIARFLSKFDELERYRKEDATNV